MGKKSIEIEKITDEKARRVCFKKRRIGLLKKAIQLSKLSGCEIQLKIYNPEDNSLLHYQSEKSHTFETRIPYSEIIPYYVSFYNENEDIVNSLENSITSHGAGIKSNKSKEMGKKFI